ncbi:MAG: serine hydroxymethyltransferase [Pseudomonadota bacterium]|nr:serine hydroxymethyltransferase [Pseudomonadota bacterium]
MTDFFDAPLSTRDPETFAAIDAELDRQRFQIELIASENIVSRAVMEAQGSVMTNKYAEGYPGKRYYGGCDCVDIAENLARERACRLFGCGYANVQPNSGSQANQAVMLAMAKPGDAIVGMALDAGGHLTHGAAPNLSGKWFDSHPYGVRESDGLIDMDQVAKLAETHKPSIIICGASAYPRRIDFALFREIADSVGAILIADIAHYAGLVVAGLYPNPFPHAHVVTTTTHKTMRGPRGGMILTNDETIAKKIDSAIFPGLQGGPLMHVIAAKAVAFGEALDPSFKHYQQAVLDNARVLAERLMARGLNIVTGGTDTHIVLVDLRPMDVTGKSACASLERAHMTCNKNAVPFDPAKPWITSGIRLGTPAGTTRGFGVAEFRRIADWIADVLEGLTDHTHNNSTAEHKAASEVAAMLARFPIYQAVD